MAGRERGLIVAIDGPAGAGKSTAARLLAARLGYALLDTGAIYRSMALRARERGVAWDNGPGVAALADGIDISFRLEGALNHVTLNGQDVTAAIRTPDMSDGASRVSALPEVRAALLAFQRDFGRAPPGAVLDGRDIGTVIFPDADVKIYVDATPEIRARRRAAEIASTGGAVSEAEVLADIRRRDERDTRRAAAPLRPAPDAHLLDTTHLDIDAAFWAAIDVVEAVRAGRKRG